MNKKILAALLGILTMPAILFLGYRYTQHTESEDKLGIEKELEAKLFPYIKTLENSGSSQSCKPAFVKIDKETLNLYCFPHNKDKSSAIKEDLKNKLRYKLSDWSKKESLKFKTFRVYFTDETVVPLKK